MAQVFTSLLLWLLSALGVSPVPREPSADWTIRRSWSSTSSGTLAFEASSTTIPPFCEAHSSWFIRFPNVVHGSHEVFADGHPLASLGDPSFRSSSGFYRQLEIPCHVFVGHKEIIWKAYSYSHFFARVPEYPKPSRNPGLQNFFAVDFHELVAGGLLMLGFLGIFAFYGKIRSSNLFLFLGSNVFFALYLLASSYGNPNHFLTMHEAHKTADASLALGLCFMTLLLCLEKVLSTRLAATAVTLAALAGLLILCGATPDATQAGTTLIFPAAGITMAGALAGSLRAAFPLKRTKHVEAFQLLSLLVFMVASLNDIVVVLGIFQSPPLFSLAATGMEIFSALSLRRRIQETYHERDELRQEVMQARVASIVAHTTQMLAHDVRKPFSLLVSVLQYLESTISPAWVPGDFPRMIREVKSSLASVNGMLQDVMEIGSAASPELSDLRVSELVLTSLREMARIFPQALVALEYSLEKNLCVRANRGKVLRVFSNILSNALEASGAKGRIWFRAEKEGRFVTITIGNDGPEIPSEIVPRLFTSFFTHGKSGGTGLGLAIAKKVIEEHGGAIGCRTTPLRHTEFFFTLPCANESEGVSDPLPPLLFELDAPIPPEEAPSPRSWSTPKNDLDVLLVDDELLYRKSLEVMVRSVVSPHSRVRTASDSRSSLEILTSARAPDLLILDVDLGPDSASGPELLKEARLRGFRGLAAIHSNRVLSSPEIADCGADAQYPKPLGTDELRELLSRLAGQGEHLCAEAKDPFRNRRRRIVLVDDSPAVRRGWRNRLQEVEVRCYTSPEELLEAPELSDLMSAGQALVVDYHFSGSAMTGLDMVREIRKRHPALALPVILSSNWSFAEGDLEGVVDVRIPKEVMSWKELEALISDSGFREEKLRNEPPSGAPF